MEAPAEPPEVHKTESRLPDCNIVTRKPYQSFREVHREQQQKRRNRTTPSPWIARKLAVFIVIGLIIFATYTYVGRACLPLIRTDPGAAGGGRPVGVVFLCIFWILWVMCVWTYAKIVFTSPGFARDFVQKGPQPIGDPVAGPRYRAWDGNSASIDPYQNDDDYDGRRHPPPSSGPVSRATTRSAGHAPPRAKELAADQDVVTEKNPTPPRNGGDITETAAEYPLEVAPSATVGKNSADDITELDVFSVVTRGHIRGQNKSRASESTAAPTGPSPAPATIPLDQTGPPAPLARTTSGLPPLSTSRQPPRQPLLAEEYRYCGRDEIIKPVRTHHCRVCATCVLNFDHHCPWIGQCVGARNRKFFMNFVFWGSLFCLWVSISLIVLAAQADGNPDAVQLVVIVLTAVFGLFTLGLFTNHAHLLMLNLTTVEEYGIKGMQEREEHVLATLFPWWNCKARARTVRAWDEEWGALKTEGNIFWLGSRRKNWEQTMGKSPWGWFLPIGASESDGLEYPINPRFTPDGRWRRRAEWDPALR